MKSWLKKAVAVLAVALLFPASASWAYFYATTVTGSVSFTASFGESISSGFPTAVAINQAITQNDNYTSSGTGSGQVNLLYAAQLTLAASTPQTIDLTTLTDPSGASINFARVREFIVQNATTTAGYDVKVSAAATTGWSILPASTAPLMCRYGSTIRISDKLSTGASTGNVVSGTSKSVTFDPGTNGPIILNVLIVGGSAA